jgi:hypothetical protein
LGHLDPALLTPIILIRFPFLITGLMIFALFFYERLNPNLLKRIQATIEKLNLSQINLPTFEEMKTI